MSKKLTKAQQKANAELFKQCTELVFNNANEELAEYSSFYKGLQKASVDSFTFEDIKYLGGYFIFEMGENSVVHFHVKECPGWLFGIWWDSPETNRNSPNPESLKITCQLFAQYENNIDKFKPSRSEFKTNITIYKEDTEMYTYVDGFVKMLNFITTEPALAFCRDYYGWDYNITYHTRTEATKKYNEYLVWYKTKEELIPQLDNKILDVVKESFKEYFDSGDMKIFDMGETWSPRYDLIFNKESIDDFKDTESGCYSIEDCFENQLLKNIYKVKKECDKIADKNKFFWHIPIDIDSVNLRTKKEMNKMFKGK